MSDRIVVRAGDEELELLAQRAVLWPTTSTLLVADTHFGKAAAFRSAGIPVPDSFPTDLVRLSDLIRMTGASRLFVVGDLVHAEDGLTDPVIDVLDSWRRSHAELTIDLVMGNHDRFPDGFLDRLVIRDRGEEVRVGPFLLRHDPDVSTSAVDGAYLVSGHVHPAVRLNGGRWQSLRLPCFVVGKRRAILPAFGTFTGTHRVRALRDDRLFVIGDDRVFAV